MEDTLQRVFSVLVAIVIFFLLPLYIAFEKKDDISYSLALKITSNFVDNVKNKGYLSKDMYNDFISNLAATGNDYDIKMEHLSKKYYPVIYSYDSNEYKNITGTFDYSLYKSSYEENKGKSIKVNGAEKTNLVLAYSLSSERKTEKQILDYLEKRIEEQNSASSSKIKSVYEIDGNSAIYPMSIGDEFTVIVKNSNVTVATMLFNTLTFGANNSNTTKIYINYGGTIQNEAYNTTELEDYVGSELSEVKYEKGSMNLCYDAIYNSSQGQDMYTTTWSDLTQNNNNGVISSNAKAEDFWNLTNGYASFKSNKNKASASDVVSINCGRIEDILGYTDIKSEKFTIECTYMSTSSNYGVLIGNLKNGGFCIYAKNNNIKIVYVTDDGQTIEKIYSTTSSKLNTVSLVYNAGTVNVYINKNSQGELTTSKLSSPQDNTVLRIGNRSDVGGTISNEPFVGVINSVRIYSKALSNAQIENNYKVDYNRFKNNDK